MSFRGAESLKGEEKDEKGNQKQRKREKRLPFRGGESLKGEEKVEKGNQKQRKREKWLPFMDCHD